ncbi:MAG: TonB-dependent receptor plug domain-containing protein [Paludibacteraceae bacterium]|nr:TonB-dependent receptor plug domain-containing protein [Paludibacteraceae bacterium]
MKKHSFFINHAWLMVLGAFALMGRAEVSAQVIHNDSTDLLFRELEDFEVSAPVTQTTVSKQEIKHEELVRDNTGQNLPVLLSKTPSLVTTSDDGLGIGYTYFRVRGSDHTRINMTINGVPLNDAESQTVFWVNMTDMSSSVTKLDVQRGVGTSANGGSSFGASINISTIDDVRSTKEKSPVQGELSFNGGMYNTFREMAKIDAYWGDKNSAKGAWHVGGRFSKVNSDGYIDRAFSDLFSYQAQLGWQNRKTAVTLLSFGGKEKTYLAWNGLTREEIEVNRRQNTAGAYLDANGNIQYYNNETDNYQQHHVHLNVAHKFNNHWSLNATGHYTFGTGYWETFDTWSLMGIAQKGLRNHFYGGILTAKYIHEKADVQMGIALNNYNGVSYGNIDQAYGKDFTEYYRGYGDKLDGNIYAKANWRVLHRGKEKLSLYGDLQYRLVNHHIYGDNDNSTVPGSSVTIEEQHMWHFFNPKAGLTYDNGGHRLSATFALANREPARSNFINRQDGEALPKPERLYDYELGYSYTSAGVTKSGYRMPWHIGLNLYFMDYKDQLVLTGEINSIAIFLTKNVDKSYRTGAELQFGVDWTKWFSWSGTLTWSRNQWKDGETWRTISFSPDWIAGNIFAFHAAGFNAEIQTSVVSKQYMANNEDPNAVLKAYTVTNLNMQYELPLQHIRHCPRITLKCQVNNVFNTMYESNGYVYHDAWSGSDIPYFMPQAGINVHAGFAVQW